MNTIVEHVYVINMKKDTERMKRFKEQVDPLFEYEIIAGVDVENDETYGHIYKKWREDVASYNIFDWKFY